MGGRDWSEAVEIAVRRLVARNGSADFTRQQMIEHELDRIVRETGSRGATPEMTLSRELQQLRDAGEIQFLTPGHYRLLDKPFLLPRVRPSKCIFVIGSDAIYAGQPDRYCQFPQDLLKAAASSVGQWIIFEEPQDIGTRGYYGAAQIEQIVRDPKNKGMFLALVVPGSFLEFGRDVHAQVSTDMGEFVSSNEFQVDID